MNYATQTVMRYGTTTQKKILEDLWKHFFDTIEPVQKNQWMIGDYISILAIIDKKMAEEKLYDYLTSSAIDEHMFYILQSLDIHSKRIEKFVWKVFIQIHSSTLSHKESKRIGYALNILLGYDEEVQKKMVEELNKLNDCTKIPNLMLTNSVMLRDLPTDLFETYKCAK